MAITERVPPETRLDLALLHARMLDIVEAAGSVALEDFVPGGETRAEVQYKDGYSPVTSADLAVDAFLAREFAAITDIAYHSEERPQSWRGATETAFVVDPIDGTRNFISGGDVWCVVVGVVEAGTSLAGVIHIPARGITLSAYRGGGVFLGRKRLGARKPENQIATATGPKSSIEHLSRLLGYPLRPQTAIPALAHRLIAPVLGEVDIALSRPGGHDWDIAAAQAILAESGGLLLDIEGNIPHLALAGEKHPALVALPTGSAEKIRPLLLTSGA